MYAAILPREKAAFTLDGIVGSDLLATIELESPHFVRPDLIEFKLKRNDLFDMSSKEYTLFKALPLPPEEPPR